MKTPFLIIAAVPATTTTVLGAFSRADGGPMSLLERPEKLRAYGWSLETGNSARIVSGKYVEVRQGIYKLIRLYEDGTLLFRGAIAPEFLGWSTHTEEEFEENPHLHSLASVEVVSLFVILYSRLLRHLSPMPKDIQFQVGIIDGKVGAHMLSVRPFALHALGSYLPGRSYALSENSPRLTMSVPALTIQGSPDVAAALVIESLFLLFGVSPESVPYITEVEGTRLVDRAAIVALT